MEGGFVVGVPTLGLVGREDGCIDPVLFDVAMGGGEGGREGGREEHPLFLKGVQVRKVEGGGHFLHQERAEDVNGLVLAWFEKYGEGGQEEGKVE